MAEFVGILGDRLTRTSKVYRTVSFERLVELLTLKRNVLVRPKLWVDTFEDLLGKSTLRIGSSGHRAIFRTDHIYGQCWTRHTVSDAIWQIYSKGTDGFRLRTRVDRLLGSLKSQTEQPDISCYIGRVRYLKDNELVEFGKTHFTDPKASPSEVVAGAFLVKRKAFEHEKEVRLIYQANSTKKEADLFRYSVDPSELVDQIMVHPMVPYGDFTRLKREIQKMGFKGEVLRSLLYAKPKEFEFQFGPAGKGR